MQAAYRATEEKTGYTREDLVVYEGKKIEMLYPKRLDKKTLVDKTVVYFVAELKNVGKEVRLHDRYKQHKWLEIGAACRTAKYQDLQNVLREVHSRVSS